jgi:hypothetical protein
MILVVILYILANLAAFAIFLMAMMRFRFHRRRYRFPESKETLLLGFCRASWVISLWLVVQVGISLLVGFLLFS